MAQTIKLGFFGTKNREKTIEAAKAVKGIKVVAFFDKCAEKAAKYAEEFPKSVVCTSLDEFLNSGIDAAVIGECAKGRPDVALACMNKGIAVLSGSMPARTLRDCVLLCRTYEATKTKYMISTPMCYTAPVLELKKLYADKSMGRVLYGAGEYNCYGDDVCGDAPALMYGTRALLPLLYITGEEPARIVSKIPFNHMAPEKKGLRGKDGIPETLVSLKSGALFKIGGNANVWPKGVWYRIGTDCGGIETKRGAFNTIRLGYLSDKKPEGFGDDFNKEYVAEYPVEIRRKYKNLDNETIAEAIMLSNFAAYVEGEAEADFDVYDAATMAAILILSVRGAFEDGIPMQLPDFRVEGIRRMYEYDLQSPIADENGFVSQPLRMKSI